MSGFTDLRKSHHIRPRMASSVFKAAKYSEGSARPLNYMATLNFTHTTCVHKNASSATSEIAAKFGRWLRYQSAKAIKAGGTSYGAPVYLTVLENPKEIHHVHWLVHVPDSLVGLFEKSVPKWLSKASGGITTPTGAIDITPIETVMAVSRYLMKGVEKHHARRCYVRPEEQGIIFGKRVAISRSLGRAARQKALAATLQHGSSRRHGTGRSAADFPNTSRI